VKRREFIVLLGGATASWPLAARAQQPAMPVVGFLNNGSAEAFAPHMAAFKLGLSDAGYVDGQNVAIEYRWAEGDNSRLPALVADLVGRPAALIAATGGVASALAAKSGTTTTPVVFAMGADPVRFGLVASLNRPGGNITGVSYLANTILEKQIEMLHESVSSVTAIGFLVNPTNPNAEQDMIAAAAASRAFGHEPVIGKASTESEIDAVIAALVKQRAGAIVIFPDALFTSHIDQLVTLTTNHMLPAIYNSRAFAQGGGLMSYGTDQASAYRKAGVYAARILKGEKPADLPVQQSTTVELVVNLKTAKTLGVSFPLTLLGRADEVIE
jgi:putative tryptophan/tyrosine transport system substrate-binding protein